MLWLATAALAAQTVQEAPRPTARPVVQARAVLRIVSAVELHLDGRDNPDVPAARATVIHAPGETIPATLIEFE